MSDMGDSFRAMKEETKKHRADMLAKADVEGWTQHTQWHFSRTFKGHRMDWWPSGGKVMYKGKMIYGHSTTLALIARLKREEA